MSKRLTERYDVERIRLKPETEESHRRLIAIIDTLRPGGSTYHILAQTPDNDSELIVVLVDDQAVVSFELPLSLSIPQEVKIYTFDEYRHAIGLGHSRILLDLAARAGRTG
ncbi:MAG: hypothetical protein J7530_20975 [Novosphingobium sp.]|nr:hypothetical protein [Novosphingobium sp.]